MKMIRMTDRIKVGGDARYCVFWLIALLILPSITGATGFTSIELPRGIGIALPTNWFVFSEEQKQLVSLSVESTKNILNYAEEDDERISLIMASSSTKNTYASVQVESYIPPSESPPYIIALNDFDLKAIKTEARTELAKGLATQGLQVLSLLEVRRNLLSGHPCLITEYTRSGPHGPVIVTVIQVFTSRQEVIVTLSYRESERAIWKPIMAVINKSISIRQ